MLWILSLWLASPVMEDRRTFADGAVQERWTWDGEKTQERLRRKEWFHDDGSPRRLEEYQDGQLHGRVVEWSRSGVKQWEKHYERGLQHGADIVWEGPEDDRWEREHRNWAAGRPHGEQVKRYDRETLELRHNYVDGKLHGVQERWDHHGSVYVLNYEDGLLHGEQRTWSSGTDLEPRQHMFFVHGEPHGEQRYRDQAPELWEEGRLHQVRSWHVEGEAPDRVRVMAMHHPELDLWDGVQDPTRTLDLWPDTYEYENRSYWPDGTLKEQELLVPPRDWRQWYANGQLAVEGQGSPSSRVGDWTEWYESGEVRIREQWSEHRTGTRTRYDRQGRVREVETWRWELQAIDVVLYEGELKVAEGPLRPAQRVYRWGEWTYYRPDGGVQRTERYDHGPYSGNRPFVVESQDFHPDGRPRCSGDERSLTCLDQTPEGLAVERRVKALSRPRHGFEVYDPETMRFVVERPEPEVHADALIMPVLDGGPGLVLEERISGPQGLSQVRTWTKEGELETIERYQAGQLTSRFEPLRGTLTGPHPDGLECQARFEDGELLFALAGEHRLGASREADKAVRACTMWSDYPEYAP